LQVIKKNGENIVTLYVKALGSLSLVATFTLEKGSKFQKCNYFISKRVNKNLVIS